MGSNSEAAKKRYDELLRLHPDYWHTISSKGGKNSGNRPFKDPEKARAAVNARWEKYRQEKKNNA